MAVVTIGAAATDRASFVGPSQSYIGKEGPADGSGKITSVEIYLQAQGGNDVIVATFEEVDTNDFTARDFQNVGAIAAGEKVVKVVDLDVVTGDYLGIFLDSAEYIERDLSGEGYWYRGGDQTQCVNYTMTWLADRTISLYGTGETVSVGRSHGHVVG